MDELHDILKQAAAGYELTPSPRVWAAVADDIARRKRRRVRLWWWLGLLLGIGACCLLAGIAGHPGRPGVTDRTPRTPVSAREAILSAPEYKPAAPRRAVRPDPPVPVPGVRTARRRAAYIPAPPHPAVAEIRKRSGDTLAPVHPYVHPSLALTATRFLEIRQPAAVHPEYANVPALQHPLPDTGTDSRAAAIDMLSPLEATALRGMQLQPGNPAPVYQLPVPVRQSDRLRHLQPRASGNLVAVSAALVPSVLPVPENSNAAPAADLPVTTLRRVPVPPVVPERFQIHAPVEPPPKPDAYSDELPQAAPSDLPDSLPDTSRPAQRGRWSLTAGIGGNSSGSRLRTSGSGIARILADSQQRRTGRLTSVAFRLQAGYRITPFLEMTAGLGIQTLGERIDAVQWVQKRSVIISGGSPDLRPFLIGDDSDATVGNRLTYLELPLSLKFRALTWRNFSLLPEAGAAANRLLCSRGYAYDSLQNAYLPFGNEKAASWLLSCSGGLTLRYAVTPALAAELHGWYRYYPGAAFSDGQGQIRRYYEQAGAGLMLRYCFLPQNKGAALR